MNSNRSVAVASVQASPPRAQQVRDAARHLFAQKGYDNCSMRDIAAEIGIRAPSIYGYVESKQGLLDELVFEWLEKQVQTARHAIAIEGSATDKLSSCIEAQVRLRVKHSDDLLVGYRELLNLSPAASIQCYDLRAQLFALWSQVLDEGVRSGEFLDQPSDIVSIILTEFPSFIQLKNFWIDGEWSETDLVDWYNRLAMNLVTAK